MMYNVMVITALNCIHGLHLKDAVPHSPSEASRLSSITTAWDSLSNELKKQVSFFFLEVGLQWGKPAVSHSSSYGQ